jgi:hypothetical protein
MIVKIPHTRSRKSGSQETRRWRKADSNRWSHLRRQLSEHASEEKSAPARGGPMVRIRFPPAVSQQRNRRGAPPTEPGTLDPRSGFSTSIPPSATPSTINDISSFGQRFGSSEPKQPPGGKMRLPSHETRFDFANSLHPARYRDNAARISSRPEVTPGAPESMGDRDADIQTYRTRTKRRR